MICADDPPFALRHHLVTFARQHGIKAAARHFQCARNTVRKWLRRFLAWGNAGLRALSRAPKSCPHKTSEPLEHRVVRLRKTTPGFGARRLIQRRDDNAQPRIHAWNRSTHRKAPCGACARFQAPAAYLFASANVG